MKLTEAQLGEAIKLRDQGVDTWSLSTIFGVHYDTMRRYLRNYETYGGSIFTANPKPVEKSVDNP